MPDPTRHDIRLTGCRPEPLMSYLKALGVLRLVSEQADSGARGWWEDECFYLRCVLNRQGLEGFFLRRYLPTPILSPWNGGGGFLSDTGAAVETVQRIRASGEPKLLRLRAATRAVDGLPAMAGFRTKRDRAKRLENAKRKRGISSDEQVELRRLTAEIKAIKQGIVTSVRNGFPEASLGWLDACLALGLEGFAASPLLGSGGLDGRLDFGANFMGNVLKVLREPESPQWLRCSLFDENGILSETSIGQFSPGQVGGPNATQGFEGNSLTNYWDFVFMMEGALVMAGAVVRRLGTGARRAAAFPFTMRPVAAGFGAACDEDAAKSRGELWLPLWNRPATAGEVAYLFGEGRADVAGRPARDGADFARAVASLGVDRGVTEFQRLAFLQRSGKNFLAAPLGRFPVAEWRETDLLREADPWLDRLARALRARQPKGSRQDRKPSAPPRFAEALRRVQSAVFDFCKYGGASCFQAILVALGAAEKELVSAARFRTNHKLRPLAGLSSQWIEAADDGSPEFEIALALASIYDATRKVGPLRANLEPVDWEKACHAWADKNHCVVWSGGDCIANLGRVLERRVMDGKRRRRDCEFLPLSASSPTSLASVATFLDGNVDLRRLEELLRGLVLVDTARAAEAHRRSAGPMGSLFVLPREYGLLKLLFLPAPILAERRSGGLHWRLARRGENGIRVRPEPRLLPLLRAGRVGDACRIAAQRLRSSGLAPMPGPVHGKTRDDYWLECKGDGRHLAAALLVPLSSASIDRLIRLVCRPSETAAIEATAIATKGE